MLIGLPPHLSHPQTFFSLRLDWMVGCIMNDFWLNCSKSHTIYMYRDLGIDACLLFFCLASFLFSLLLSSFSFFLFFFIASSWEGLVDFFLYTHTYILSRYLSNLHMLRSLRSYIGTQYDFDQLNTKSTSTYYLGVWLNCQSKFGKQRRVFDTRKEIVEKLNGRARP